MFLLKRPASQDEEMRMALTAVPLAASVSILAYFRIFASEPGVLLRSLLFELGTGSSFRVFGVVWFSIVAAVADAPPQIRKQERAVPPHQTKLTPVKYCTV